MIPLFGRAFDSSRKVFQELGFWGSKKAAGCRCSGEGKSLLCDFQHRTQDHLRLLGKQTAAAGRGDVKEPIEPHWFKGAQNWRGCFSFQVGIFRGTVLMAKGRSSLLEAPNQVPQLRAFRMLALWRRLVKSLKASLSPCRWGAHSQIVSLVNNCTGFSVRKAQALPAWPSSMVSPGFEVFFHLVKPYYSRYSIYRFVLKKHNALRRVVGFL